MSTFNLSFHHDKIKSLSKSKQSAAAQKILSDFLFAGRIRHGIGIDTLRLTIELPRPETYVLETALGFRRQKPIDPHPFDKFKNKNKVKDTCFYNHHTAFDTIKFHWTKAPDNRDWLSVEVSSLAAYATGDCRHVFASTAEILAAIDSLSEIASFVTSTKVNLRRGHCSRLDLFLDFDLGSDKAVNDVVKLSRYLKVSRHELLGLFYFGTTRFQNYGRHIVTHELDFYNKSKKEREGGNLYFPSGVLRIEQRILETQTFKRLASPDYYDPDTKTYNLDCLFDLAELERLFDFYLPLNRNSELALCNTV